MKEECLICKAPLEYLEKDVEMECVICHKKEMSKTRCVNGHYVCSECHMSGIDSMFSVCMQETSKNPIEIIRKIMDMPFCHMHGPEHHIMVGASLLTAFRNAGGEVNLEEALREMYNRGKNVPGGICGFWGSCGAGVSTGIYMSIVTKATPLTVESWSFANKMTSCSLCKISENGGPRCCKRNSYLAIGEAVKFTKEKLGVEMETGEVVCTHSHMNNQCIKERCPFYKKQKQVAKILNLATCILFIHKILIHFA